MFQCGDIGLSIESESDSTFFPSIFGDPDAHAAPF
jgi:hypothetical protein